MDITVSARHTELSPALRSLVDQKIGRLARYHDGFDRAKVHFWEERNRRIPEPEICEVTLDGRGGRLHCKVAGADGFVAIDKAARKLEHQVLKVKTKKVRRRTGAADGRASLRTNGLAAR